MTTPVDPNAENNEKAVILSEELDFLEALLADYEHDPSVVTALLERRDVVRDAIRTSTAAEPADEASEGTPLPEEDTP